MEYFLECIAKTILNEFSDRLDAQCLVFPNRRAGLFFMKYLASETDKPVWAPAVMTINELFRSLSPLMLAENEVLLFELFRELQKFRKTRETFDDFYYWGDILLNDFDDIDKYLVDAATIFRNVQDLKMIDHQFGGLTPDQIEIIRRFWNNFDAGKQTDEKKRFADIWSVLADVYTGFRASLRLKNYAYEGMIFRDVIDHKRWMNQRAFRWDKVHFIGFNALNECEKTLMSILRNDHKAKFYWDYDDYYLKSGDVNSAGNFLKENIKKYGNDMPPCWKYNTLLTATSGTVSRKVIETSSDIAQVKLIPRLLMELPDLKTDNAHQTAIVLADENLLIPLLSSLPEEIGDVNITMGYPMRETPVFHFVKSLLDLQSNASSNNENGEFHSADILKVLSSTMVVPFMTDEDKLLIEKIVAGPPGRIKSDYFGSSEFLHLLFRKQSNPLMLADYLNEILHLIVRKNLDESDGPDIQAEDLTTRKINNEFVFRAVLAINRMKMLTDDPEIKFNVGTFAAMLERILRIQSVPFSGEPLSGIQIMGILETRTLDFRNLIILSVNEGVLPSVTTSSSFIPFSLREAFGLPSINHQESIYAYHFYRLLHRAQNVTFIYNSNSEGMRSGEMSRFLLQMKYEPVMQPDHTSLSFEIKNPPSPRTYVERSEVINQKLLSRFTNAGTGKILSPSAINIWLGCRMKFYYRYVNDLREPQRIKGEIDPAILGSIFHIAVKRLYNPYLDKIITVSAFDTLRRNREYIYGLVESTIKENLLTNNDSYSTINNLITSNVLFTYISRVLEIDQKSAPIKIIALEKPVEFTVKTGLNAAIDEFLMGGVIDRIDIRNDKIRIIDYKTGSAADHIKSVGELFLDDRKKDLDCWLQTLLYCEGYLSENPEAVVAPLVYKVRRIPGDKSTEKLIIKEKRNEELVIDNYNSIRHEYLEGLSDTIQAMFNEGEPFVMTADQSTKCPYCEYRKLCKR